MKYLDEKITFHSICKKIKKFKRDYGYAKEMNSIRNFTSGHIDTDFLLFYDTIKSINVQKAIEAISSFVEILSLLLEFSAKLATTANSLAKQKHADTDERILEFKNKIEALLNSKVDNNYS